MPEQPSIDFVARDRFDEDCRLGEITAFDYTPNNRGFIFLQICAGILFVMALTVYLETRFETGYWSLLSGLLILGGIVLVSLAVRWSSFAKRSRVGLDPGFLYVAKGKKVARVRRDHLTKNTLFGDDDNADLGTIFIRFGQKRLPLLLFNPYVVIEDYPSLVAELLAQLKENSSSDSAAVEESASTDESDDSEPSQDEP